MGGGRTARAKAPESPRPPRGKTAIAKLPRFAGEFGFGERGAVANEGDVLTTGEARSTGYRVQSDLFSGPLDLLLYLVRRNELNLAELRLADITRHFLDHLAVLQFLDLDAAGEFVVMASTLVELKSREALPRPPEETAEAEPADDDGLRTELIQQLLEYRKYKEAAAAIEAQASEWLNRYPRMTSEQPRAARDHASDAIKEVELWDLVSALSRVLQRKVVESKANIVYDETPISTYVERIGEQVRAEGRVSFSSLFAGAAVRSKIIGLFLAILELLRHHGFRAEQPVDYSDIFITPPLDAPSEEAPPQVSAAVDENSGDETAVAEPAAPA